MTSPAATATKKVSWLPAVPAQSFAEAGFSRLPGCAALPHRRCGLKFEVPHSLCPLEHRFLEISSDIALHDVDEGQGDVLLMLYGNSSWSFLYRKIIVRLHDGFRCVAPDYPRFGLSEAPSGYGFTPREHSDCIERFADCCNQLTSNATMRLP